ncbi:hypothetical protein N7540_013075 [Penicillium herquei]|nr:hypothetical protein N7540_013075 [Penicillium herquei]
MFISFFLVFTILQTFAEATIAPPYLPSLVNRAQNALHKRSPGLYAAILRGDGTTADGWPSIDQWVDSVETMFERNRQMISASCSQWGLSNNSEDETNSIKNAILKVERSSGIDARFILSIVLQESQGCVRVQTTDNGVVNPGLMQSHDGSSCNKNGMIQDPCPESEILQMIIDGVEGTSTGPGLRTLVAQEGGTADATSFYKAARAYNSGAVASSGDLGQGRATHCYVSDIVNRLVEWTDGPSLCALGNADEMSAEHWESKTDAEESGHGATSTTTARSLTQTQGADLINAGLLYPSITQISVKRPSASLSYNQNPLFCKRNRSSLAI